MALQSSGAISLANIQTEFGGSNPIGLNEYYDAADGIPASGTISLEDFYGTSAFTATVATGGSITTVGDYKVHTFTGSGTFTITTLGTNTDVEYLVVAGGGGGGASIGGGGGAGGMRTGTITGAQQSYTITVGGGGAGSNRSFPLKGSPGSNSVFGAITSTGGGYGAGEGAATGGSGGSGVVILRYPNTKTITIGSGLTGTTATDGNDKVTSFTAGTGNISFS